MTGFVPVYGASATVFTSTALDSLASSSSWLAGWSSAVITNTYNDVLLSGRFKANATAPTAGQIQVWVVAALNDTPAYPDTFDGTSKATTITSADIRGAIARNVFTVITDVTANRIYEMAPVNIAQFFGGVTPPKYQVFVAHSMVQALNITASAGGQMWIQGETYPA